MAFTINSMAQSGTGFNSLFGVSGSNNSGNGIYSLLGDYSSIKTGSYGRLVSKYLSESDDSSSKKSSSTINDTKSKLSSDVLKPNAAYTALNDTKALQSSIKALSDEELYKEGADSDKLYEKAKAFVDDYNDLLDSAGRSNVSGLKTNVNSIVSRTATEKSNLEGIGITVKSDNSLSIDKDKFNAADRDEVKKLLGQTGGYASMVGVNANGAEYYAQAAASSGSLYGNSGSYSYGSFGSSFSVYS